MKEGGRTMKRNHKAKDKEEEREEFKENNNNEVVDSRSQGGEGGSQLQSVLTTACTSYHYDMPYALILDYLKAVAVAPELFNLHLDFYRIMHSLLQISYDYMRIDMGKDKHLHDVYIDICNYPADPTPFDSLVDHIGKLVKVEGTIVKMSQPFLMPIGYKLVCRFCKHNKIVYIRRPYTNLTGDNNNILDDDKMLRCMICDVDLDIEPLYLGYYKLTLQEDIGTQKSVRMVDCIIEARRLLDYNSDNDGGYNDSRKIIKRKADLGDKVSVLGVVTPILATSSKKGGNGNNHHGMAATSIRAADICIDAYHLEQLKKSNVTLSDYDIEIIQSLLRKKPNNSIYELLVSSFAPHIYGHKVIKEAILLQLALTGISNSKHYTKRMNLHILLVGDPGTAKSQLLLYTAQIAPIAIYTTGKGSSAAGLSVAVVKDDSSSKGLTASTGGYTIVAGATVLASGGIACIDEFLTMRSEDRAVLHEIMEQQTVSIAKAGINASFKAETSILAACNPIRGYYDPYRSLLENIEILPSLLSRFDLVFVVRDEKDTDTDTNISNAIISSMYRRRGEEEEENTELGKVDGIKLSKEMLTKWLIYCKRFYPIMSESAAKRLQEYYLKLRAKSSVTEGMLITPRQLETLIRLATARARLLCREDVIADDIDAAIRVYEHMLSTFIDTTTKHPDIGVMTGTSVGERAKRSIFLTVMKNLQTKYPSGVTEETIISELVKTNQFTEETAQIYLSMAKREGLIYEVERDKFKLV